DLAEAEITSKLADLAHAERETHWQAFLQRYAGALQTYIESVKVAANCRAALVALREEAIGAGAEGLLHRLPVPTPRPPLDLEAIRDWAGAARADLAAAHLPPRAEILVPVRFVQRYSIWNSGEVAGFSAAEAKQLIGWGVAKPASVPVETQLPPQPSQEE